MHSPYGGTWRLIYEINNNICVRNLSEDFGHEKRQSLTVVTVFLIISL